MIYKRGEMYAPEMATQERDYSGLRWGKMTPTDIDGLIDFWGKAWVLFELKHIGAQMPDGQRIAFERLVDDLDITKPSIAFIAEHDICDVIDAANATVTKFRWSKKWIEETRGMTLKEAIDSFLKQRGVSLV